MDFHDVFNYPRALRAEISGVDPSVREKNWSPIRKTLRTLLDRKTALNLIMACITVNVVTIIIETDSITSATGDAPRWVIITNGVLLLLFLLEILLRMFVWRLHFFCSGWNILDFCVITLDIIFMCVNYLDTSGESGPKLTVLRMFRLVRVARAARALHMFPELRLILGGFVAAIRAIVWGTALIVIIVIIWAILAVQIVHPINQAVPSEVYHGCDRCPRAFSTVWYAFLTIWQTVICGDNWGTVAVPICEQSPPVIIFFVCVSVSLNIAMLNLILASIVDASQGLRKQEDEDLLAEEQRKFIERTLHLEQLCRTMDANGDGVLSKDEMYKGFDTNDDFKNLMSEVGIKRSNLSHVFEALDADGSGDINYQEFAESIIEAKTQDLNTALFLVRMQVFELQHQLLDFMTDQAPRGDLDSRQAGHSAGEHVGRGIGSENSTSLGTRLATNKSPHKPYTRFRPGGVKEERHRRPSDITRILMTATGAIEC